ncbi:hypothetical protein Q4543_16640 [Salipiger sp. 1_MG-2023]|uniref:hypothetical protein n=1 Tax=Salipiger sp. 1_MG-2023 TaxID=3062665 RepID=UPI0026E362D0|nr:hypothetical protein [Salipiger sp. 1_MG-2023]MDO6587137.1 hypothetical protein [Salipiger sp. 1_MG-2023]MDO6587144.1 hypothetical protein [Salipiger sp. 1_MG-2023]
MTASYKGKKRGFPKHVRLLETLQQTEAWRSLKPGPRALYVELRRRYNGANNGRIFMSHREAADLLNVHRNTVPDYFSELERRHLIRDMGKGYLGADGHGIATRWALCDEPMGGKAPDLSYRSWTEKQNPGIKAVLTRHKNCASGS